jgi:hypothetical protein
LTTDNAGRVKFGFRVVFEFRSHFQVLSEQHNAYTIHNDKKFSKKSMCIANTNNASLRYFHARIKNANGENYARSSMKTANLATLVGMCGCRVPTAVAVSKCQE